jgi:hypothetical protein
MLELMLGVNKPGTLGYDQFLTWMTQQGTTITERIPGNTTGNYVGYLKVKMPTTYAGNLWGSPYLSYYTYDSVLGRVAQHAFPTLALANEAATNQRYVLMKSSYVGTKGPYSSVTRNGYTSLSYSTYNGAFCDDFVYFDSVAGMVMRWNPQTNSAITPFDSKLK